MNRHEFLRAVLMGKSPEVKTERDIIMEKWATTLEPLISPSIYTPLGRHLNHFCVGSDPEFSLRDEDGARVEAFGTGLKVGLAVGADQNERLVELRPWPSVSVVEHVAGIMCALRWMYRVYNRRVRTLQWRAGAWFAGDGMGGHVHFGRKRPTRDEEVLALDGLARVMKTSGLFPIKEWDRRMKGDNYHNAPYGLPGDFRVQCHGYEYRSLPSWLQSPVVAFIVLASSKLAVLDPEVTSKWGGKITPVQARNLLRGLTKLYKGRDDDAYILYHILTQTGDTPFLFNYEADFAPNWGMNRDEVIEGENDTILPSCIKPEPEEIIEMQNHLLFGIPLTFRRVVSSFKSKLPTGEEYCWMPNIVAPGRRSGYGDLIHNLVVPRKAEFFWDYSNADNFKISGGLPLCWSPSDRNILRKYYPQTVIIGKGTDKFSGTTITVPKALCQTQTIAGFRAILVSSGLFPIWTVDSIQKDSLASWIESRKKVFELRNWRTH